MDSFEKDGIEDPIGTKSAKNIRKMYKCIQIVGVTIAVICVIVGIACMANEAVGNGLIVLIVGALECYVTLLFAGVQCSLYYDVKAIRLSVERLAEFSMPEENKEKNADSALKSGENKAANTGKEEKEGSPDGASV